MSDALLHGMIMARFSGDYTSGKFWKIRLNIDSGTVLPGYMDGSGTARFYLPIGAYARPISMMVWGGLEVHNGGDKKLYFRWSPLSDSAASAEVILLGTNEQSHNQRRYLRTVTDGFGMNYLEIAVPSPAGTSGGAIGTLQYDRSTYKIGKTVYSAHCNIWFMHGYPNRPWITPILITNPARLENVAGDYESPQWDVDLETQEHWRHPRRVMTQTTQESRVTYDLYPYVDDGSYAWLFVNNTAGADRLMPSVEQDEAVTVYTATGSQTFTTASRTRSDESGFYGRSIRLKKGSSRCMGFARAPVRVYGGYLDAHPPFSDTMAETGNLPEDNTRPLYLPAYITVEDNVAYANIRIRFQNDPHVMGWKTDADWSFATALHEDADPAERPSLYLCADGSSTNILSGITLEGTGGSASYIAQDAGGITLRARLTSVPGIGEHACFVKCQGAYLKINSPAANGNGESAPVEESFNPYT